MLLPPTKPPSEDEVRALLRERGLSPTTQRVTVACAALGDATHPTADIIAATVRDRAPGISQATVYNTLNKLVDRGLLVRVQRPGERVRYDNNTTPHPHLYDPATGALYDLDPAHLDLHLTSEASEHLDVASFEITVVGRVRDPHGEPTGGEPTGR